MGGVKISSHVNKHKDQNMVKMLFMVSITQKQVQTAKFKIWEEGQSKDVAQTIRFNSYELYS